MKHYMKEQLAMCWPTELMWISGLRQFFTSTDGNIENNPGKVRRTVRSVEFRLMGMHLRVCDADHPHNRLMRLSTGPR